ncbi:DUF932 domain-containing protein [Candidatus Parcubacteria bacterium]|nr:MAG: DUF932 domain-containing protein [Candidatus Parcubacteria bacterium]
MGHLFNKGFTVREPAWHASETGCVTLDDYPGMEQAIKIAGHDHDILTTRVALEIDGQWVPTEGWKGLYRSDNKKVVNIPNSTYEVIQNQIPWSLIDQLFQNGAKWDTAGILKGHYNEKNKEQKGQTYWCMALLDEPKAVNGDDSLIYPYIAATWNHCGLSLRFRAINTRIVCANTHHAAMYGADGADLEVSIRHFGKMEERMEKAKMAISLARKSHNVFMELANELASMYVTDAGIETFIETIVPMPEADIISERVQYNIECSRRQVLGLFNGKTINPAIRNTAYGLVEVGVEYFDHIRRSMNKDTYFTRNVLTVGAQKAKLIDTAREIANSLSV